MYNYIKAPGDIEKPSQLNKPRGRPALAVRNTNICYKNEYGLKDKKFKFQKEKNRNKIYWE